MGVANAGDNISAIVFDLHASAAAIALLAAPKFVIYDVERDRHSGGKTGESGHQALAMRLPGGFKSQHLPGIFMLTGSVLNRFDGLRPMAELRPDRSPSSLDWHPAYSFAGPRPI